MAENELVTMHEESTSEEEESSHSSSCLSLHYSFPPLNTTVTLLATMKIVNLNAVLSRTYTEPERESGSESESGASSDDESRLEERLLNSEW